MLVKLASMAFFIEVQVFVNLPILSEADFSNLAAVYYNGNSLKAQQSPGYVRNFNQLFVRTYVVE